MGTCSGRWVGRWSWSRSPKCPARMGALPGRRSNAPCIPLTDMSRPLYHMAAEIAELIGPGLERPFKGHGRSVGVPNGDEVVLATLIAIVVERMDVAFLRSVRWNSRR
jgi:hypothetical protein